jgi:phage gp36-like protein
MTAFATAADMTKRYDVRLLGDLVSDGGVRVGHPDILVDVNLQTAIEDAAGEIMTALLTGRRYSEADLHALTGNSLQFLKRINCVLALDNLYGRRPWSDDQRRMQAIDKADAARNDLDSLRTGKTVLNTEEAKDAGLPGAFMPQIAQITPLNLSVDRAREGYYLTRQLPTA